MRFLLLILPIFCSAQLRVEFSPQRLEAIVFGKDTMFLQGKIGALYSSESVKVGDSVAWSKIKKTVYKDSAYTYSYDFGDIVVKYRPVADTLFIHYTVPKGVQISIRAMHLRTPGRQEYETNKNFAASIVLQQLAIDNPDPLNNAYIGAFKLDSLSTRIWTGTYKFNGQQDYVNVTDTSWTIALRFGGNSKKLFEDYAKAYPVLVKWDDRRPIGALMLASYKQAIPTNPRNWIFVDEKVDVIKSYRDLRKRLMAYVDNSIIELKKCNAQGMITWDIEGQQWWHPFSYIGAPEYLDTYAPEIEDLADEYFKRFRMAGFRVGICIRPDSIISPGKRVNVNDPARIIIARIKHAQARWGCSLFYVDSNVDTLARVLHQNVFEQVQKACPDVLVMPEHSTNGYYRFSVPYGAGRFSQYEVPRKVRAVYPDAFRSYFMADDSNYQTGVQVAKQQESIIIFRAWFADPLNKLLYK